MVDWTSQIETYQRSRINVWDRTGSVEVTREVPCTDMEGRQKSDHSLWESINRRTIVSEETSTSIFGPITKIHCEVYSEKSMDSTF